MAVRYAALSASEKYGCPQCVPKSTSVTPAVDEKTLPMATITGRTDRQTDRQTDRRTDRMRRNMRPPPREEGRITKELGWLSYLSNILSPPLWKTWGEASKIFPPLSKPWRRPWTNAIRCMHTMGWIAWNEHFDWLTDWLTPLSPCRCERR